MKKTNENLVILITLFAISIVIANVTGARTITTGLHIGPIELALSGGAITYAVTFLCTDIIGEIWGKATAQRVVKYGFIGQIFATACIMITGVFPATDAVMDNAYQTLLGQNWIFVIGSLSAYLVIPEPAATLGTAMLGNVAVTDCMEHGHIPRLGNEVCGQTADDLHRPALFRIL